MSKYGIVWGGCVGIIVPHGKINHNYSPYKQVRQFNFRNTALHEGDILGWLSHLDKLTPITHLINKWGHNPRQAHLCGFKKHQKYFTSTWSMVQYFNYLSLYIYIPSFTTNSVKKPQIKKDTILSYSFHILLKLMAYKETMNA